MRQALRDLITKTILFKYELPNSALSILKSKISTDNDSCYSIGDDDGLTDIIYNAVIEYAFNEYEITEQDFDVLHRRALTRKLKFNDEAKPEQQLKYGFYGEVILYCMLYLFYKVSPVIARGHLYQILENGETKGYDAYHLIDNQGQVELWFGEAKFYGSFSAATTGKNGALTNLKKAISDEYLNTNLIAISERESDLAITGSALKPILKDLKDNPDIQISVLSKKHNIKLVYPVLILFSESKVEYDNAIRNSIKHIEENFEEAEFKISVPVSLFFIFIPLNSAKSIKSKVIECIKNKKQLIS